MRTHFLLVLPLIAFAITLGIVIGERLSQEAMIVVIGVVAGIAASIPTSLLTAWIVAHKTRTAATASTPIPAPPRTPSSEEPRILVVHAPAPPSAPAALYPEMAREPRRFNIIGDPDPPA